MPCKAAEFVLSGNLTDLKWILDLVLYAWLFFTPYTLFESRILLQKVCENRTHLFIPIT